MEAEKHKNPLIIAIRHGERADLAGDSSSYEIPFDPCLTERGMKQAFQTGLFLQKHFNLSGRKVYVYSSPLLRTMQTAAQVLKATGLVATHKIMVRNYLVEELYTQYFPKNPLKNCLIRTRPYDYIRDKMLAKTEYEDNDLTELKFPEKSQQATDRCKVGFEYFIREHSHEPEAAVILVGHGRIVDEFNACFGNIYMYNYQYCAVSAAELVGKEWNLILSDYHSHIKDTHPSPLD